MKKRIIIYGGAFNPPHKGHAAVIQAVAAALGRLNAEELWIMPSGARYDKALKVSGEDRRAMLAGMLEELFPEGNARVTVSSFEIEDPKLIATYQTKKKLEKIYPDTEFIFTVGSDVFPHIAKWWKQGEKLLDEGLFLVVERHGYSIPAHFGKRVFHLPIAAGFFRISSTKIRERIQKGESIDEFVTPYVVDYIKQRRFYL